MREILFRGKRIDGLWVGGHGITVDESETRILSDLGDSYGLTWCRVYPETVGQFTGLTDKNGKKIFEGDIIRSDNGKFDAVSVVKYGNFRPKMIYDMFWNYTGHFPKQNLHGVYCESNKEVMMLFDSPTCIEVIGNIHDNPDLLEGGAEDGK